VWGAWRSYSAPEWLDVTNFAMSYCLSVCMLQTEVFGIFECQRNWLATFGNTGCRHGTRSREAARNWK
jgi:hypothetical protein